jgi:crossover junction endodeoxyribonuclease RusA
VQGQLWSIFFQTICWNLLQVFKKVSFTTLSKTPNSIRENPYKHTDLPTVFVDNLRNGLMMIELDLPWPPSVNHYKKVGRIVKTKSGKLYQQRVNTNDTKKYYFDVYMLYKAVKHAEWLKFADSETISFDLRVYLYPPNESRYDIDNRLKVLFDSLTRAKVIKDDSQITRLYVEKCNIIEHGKVVVRIQEIL